MSATGMMLPGDGSNPPENSNATPDQGTGMGDDQQSTATQQSAYVAPTDGQATICLNCIHFDGQGSCDQPEVIADPEVGGKVDPNGHSKFYAPKSAGGGAQLGMGKKAPPAAGLPGLAAGARFPAASNTPNFQGD